MNQAIKNKKKLHIKMYFFLHFTTTDPIFAMLDPNQENEAQCSSYYYLGIFSFDDKSSKTAGKKNNLKMTDSNG